MACDINSGRTLSCKDAVGGLKNIYFMNFSDLAANPLLYNTATETVTGVTAVTGTTIYKYELHLGNDLTQNVQSSPENGTLYFEQVLSITLKKLSAVDNVKIKELSSGHPVIIVEDQMGNFMFVGRTNGSDVTGGTAVSGNAFGDLNGYTLTFTAQEPTLANFYTGTLATDFIISVGV